MKSSIKPITNLWVVFILSIVQLTAQPSTTNERQQDNLQNTILKLDQNFWQAYNSCDVASFSNFLTQDLEFYHDKGGLTSGLEKMLSLVKNGLCGNENFRLRREAVPGTVKIYPIKDIGAILLGEHLFYANETGKPEKLIEKAKFTHLWRKEGTSWKMARVLSYDHQPTSVNESKNSIEIAEETLMKYSGTYLAPKTGKVTITIEKNYLHITTGKMQIDAYPESETVFFSKKEPLSFTFVMNGTNDTVHKMEVRENGTLVEEVLKDQ